LIFSFFAEEMGHHVGNLLVIKPNGIASVVPWENDVKDPPLGLLQIHVEGFVDFVEINYRGKNCVAYFNEEGTLRGLPVNETGSRLCGFRVVGSLVIDL
jgi:hypothetical protein